jgi:hypothetical protein
MEESREVQRPTAQPKTNRKCQTSSEECTLASPHQYSLKGRTFTYDAEMLSFYYNSFTQMTDEEFIENLPKVLHFTCYMSFVLKLDHVDTLSDVGIIHELVHLLNEGTKRYVNINKVRELFSELFANQPDMFDIKAKYSLASGQ